MTDPFSILVGAVSLAGAALKVAQTTEDFIKGIKGAPQAVQSLSSEINTLREILKSLDALLDDGQNRRRNNELVRLSPVLVPPLNYCKKTLDDVDEGVRPFVRPLDGSMSLSKWRAFQWKYRERDVMILRQNLNNSQMMLSAAVQVVSLSSQAREFGNMKDVMQRGFNFDMASVADTSFIGSDEPVTEYNFALKRYLLDAEVVPDGDLHSSMSAGGLSPWDLSSQIDQTTQFHGEEAREGVADHGHTLHNLFQGSASPTINEDQFPDALPLEEGTQLKRNANWNLGAKDNQSASDVRKARLKSKPIRVSSLSAGEKSTEKRQDTVLRKTIVSREAILQLGYIYMDEGSLVRFTRHLGPSEVAVLREKSLEISSDRRTWWPTISTRIIDATEPFSKKETGPMINLASAGLAAINPLNWWDSIRPSAISVSRRKHVTQPPVYESPTLPSEVPTQLLRKTIVSKAALETAGKWYREEGKYVRVAEMDGNSVAGLRRSSQHIDPNPKGWWDG